MPSSHLLSVISTAIWAGRLKASLPSSSSTCVPSPFCHLPSSHVLRSQMLRQFAPQFAERSRVTGGYSQQDAQEAWTSILNAIKPNLKVDRSPAGKFVQQYLTGEMTKTCVELCSLLEWEGLLT